MATESVPGCAGASVAPGPSVHASSVTRVHVGKARCAAPSRSTMRPLLCSSSRHDPGSVDVADHGDVVGHRQQQWSRGCVGVALAQQRVDLERGSARVRPIRAPAVVDDALEHRDRPDAHAVILARLDSPMCGAGAALERADDLRRDPAAVEAALVRLHQLVVDVARVDALRIERQVVLDRRGTVRSGRDRSRPRRATPAHRLGARNTTPIPSTRRTSCSAVRSRKSRFTSAGGR